MTPEPTPTPIPPPSAPRPSGAASHLAEALSAAKRIARQVDEPELLQDESETPPTVSDGAPVASGAPESVPESPEDEPVPDQSDREPDAQQEAEPGAPVDDIVEDTDAGGADTEDTDADGADTEDTDDEDTDTDGADEGDVPSGRATSFRRTGSRSTRLLLAFMVVVLVAMPFLGYVGYHLLTTSTRGKVLSGVSAPDEPGYQVGS